MTPCITISTSCTTSFSSFLVTDLFAHFPGLERLVRPLYICAIRLYPLSRFSPRQRHKYKPPGILVTIKNTRDLKAIFRKSRDALSDLYIFHKESKTIISSCDNDKTRNTCHLDKAIFRKTRDK